jgi:hypothetical protein
MVCMRRMLIVHVVSVVAMRMGIDDFGTVDGRG